MVNELEHVLTDDACAQATNVHFERKNSVAVAFFRQTIQSVQEASRIERARFDRSPRRQLTFGEARL
jgi:hypothetical protein